MSKLWCVLIVQLMALSASIRLCVRYVGALGTSVVKLLRLSIPMSLSTLIPEPVGTILVLKERGKKTSMQYYGIKTPEREDSKSYIYWIAEDEYKCWQLFFRDNTFRTPLCEAKEAYTAIGYRCVELEITVKEGQEEDLECKS